MNNTVILLKDILRGEELENRTVNIPLSNFYGNVSAIKDGEKFFMTLDDHSHTSRVEISERLFSTIESEFGHFD